MRTLTAYLLALLAVAAGLWFGFRSMFESDRGAAAAQRQPTAAPVITAPVTSAQFSDSLQALGTALANESVWLTANRSEHVRALHFDDGQEVQKGDLLVELEVAEERAMLAETQALRADRRAAHTRAVELFEQRIAPESEIETALAQLEAADARVRTLEATIADHQLRAPFAGQLGLRQVSVGALLQPSTVIATLDDLSVVKVDFTIPETWLAAVRVGMPVATRTDAFPGQVFPGSVSAVDTRLDRRTRSATVRAIVPNGDRLLRPGMLMKVVVDRGEAAVLQVPEAAIVPRGAAHYVMLVDAASVAHETLVEVGRRRAGRVEILSGLDAGQQVVVEGLVRVRDGGPVKVVDVRGEGD